MLKLQANLTQNQSLKIKLNKLNKLLHFINTSAKFTSLNANKNHLIIIIFNLKCIKELTSSNIYGQSTTKAKVHLKTPLILCYGKNYGECTNLTKQSP